MMTLRKSMVLVSIALLSALGATNARADTLVDRGLPTANLNNAAGANRSNVAWLFGGYAANDYWLVGDTFTNTSSQSWSINTIRLWSMKATESASLWGGVDGSAIGIVSSSGVVSNALYSDSSKYQVPSDAYRDMYQIDFAVNVTLAAGQTYDFFFDGRSSDSGHTLAFVHASNGALSGSPQDGADNAMLAANVLNGNLTGVESWSSLGNGWDKASDVNVQVFGSAIAPIPEPETYAMMLAGLGLLGLTARRQRQKPNA